MRFDPEEEQNLTIIVDMPYSVKNNHRRSKLTPAEIIMNNITSERREIAHRICQKILKHHTSETSVEPTKKGIKLWYRTQVKSYGEHSFIGLKNFSDDNLFDPLTDSANVALDLTKQKGHKKIEWNNGYMYCITFDPMPDMS